MTDPAPMNAVEIADAAASLGAHLERAGVHVVPAVDNAASLRWQRQMMIPEVSPGSDARLPKKPLATKPSRPPASSSIESSANHRLAPVPPSPAPTPSSSNPYPDGLPVADRRERLDHMADQVASCDRCGELSRCRNRTVFGEGNMETTRFLFFGEGPGADEDRTGRPFVGRAGQLLTKMIEACKLDRDEVYITNTVKCRPPGNRNPEHDEIENCRPYFEQQFEILRPEYIICLGAVSARALLQTKLSIGRLRQRFHPYRDSKVLVIYHPAYLLRNPDAKRAAWADLQLMMSDAGLK
ncbi:MAG: uracil-DNA glycosylase [Planctomycetota bacterium]